MVNFVSWFVGVVVADDGGGVLVVLVLMVVFCRLFFGQFLAM